MAEIKRGQHWRHLKRGSVYEIVDDNAHVQIAKGTVSPDGDSEEYLEDQRWVAYQSINAFGIYFRMYEEFGDGRFELMKEAD